VMFKRRDKKSLDKLYYNSRLGNYKQEQYMCALNALRNILQNRSSNVTFVSVPKIKGVYFLNPVFFHLDER